jgi:DNA-binding TFAR19-related protein (PDSD5 family)
MYAEELMAVMSDSELEAIRRNKLQELQRRLVAKEEKSEEIDADDVLKQVFKGRAQEVFNSAYQQFPGVMSKVKDVLVRLALSGRLKEVTGEQLYFFLRNVGLRVRLNTKIRFAEHGKLKSLTEKMKEDL